MSQVIPSVLLLMAMRGIPATGPICNVQSRRRGRNQACFCGSGRKFKHCHYPRAKARPFKQPTRKTLGDVA